MMKKFVSLVTIVGVLMSAGYPVFVSFPASATSSSGSSSGSSDGGGRDPETNNPPNTFNPDANPFGPGGNGVPPHDNNPETPPFGQGYVGPDGSITIENPPGNNWGPITIVVGPPSPLKPKTYDWVDGAVMATNPAWAMHNMSLLYKAGKMTVAEYAAGLAMTLGLTQGTSVTIGMK